ncbi:hypothetical protein HD554DRAFT_985928 [Boletus coccyginus]|nr:hypothetical protein HD554DRAFT_985928 [Boletus coccyginus]
MVPKFANPHSLSQEAEITTRSDHSLQRDLDNLLRDTWADTLAETSSLPRAKKNRETTESSKNEDGHVVFRLVSSVKHPQRISLDPKLPPLSASRDPDCEDDEVQAETRKTRSLSIAVDFESIIEAAISTRQLDPKPATIVAKAPLTNTAFARPLPPLLVIEEVRKTVRHVKTRGPRAGESSAVSPHVPRPSCVVLPVTSISVQKEMAGKKRRKRVRERPPPAYWRPSPDQRGQCMGGANPP